MNIFKKLFGRKQAQVEDIRELDSETQECIQELVDEVEEPEIIDFYKQKLEMNQDPVIADYERLIAHAETPEERADYEKNLERYKKKRGL